MVCRHLICIESRRGCLYAPILLGHRSQLTPNHAGRTTVFQHDQELTAIEWRTRLSVHAHLETRESQSRSLGHAFPALNDLCHKNGYLRLEYLVSTPWHLPEGKRDHSCP